MTPQFWSWAPLAVILFQAVCLIHLFRTGRGREWIYLILLLPFFGSLIYFVQEMLPTLRGTDLPQSPAGRLFAGNRLKQLEKQRRLADTDTNRLRLAAAYAAEGRFDAAMELTQSCLKGIYSENPGMMQDMARYSFGAGKYDQSIFWFDKVHALTDRRIGKPENELLYARALELAGHHDRAKEAYRYVIRMHHSMEGRYRYGQMLLAAGQHAEARAQFQAILDEREHHPPHVRRAAGEWIRGARAALRKERSVV